jgi:hypothetical protein
MGLAKRTATFCVLSLLILVCSGGVSFAASDIEVQWDTLYTHDGMYTGTPPGVECVGLVVSNHGEMGHAGLGRVNMDYAESGLECGTRPEDAVYLYSGSPFVILADDASGTNASLTCSYGDVDGAKPCAWVPTDKPGSSVAILVRCLEQLRQYSTKMVSKEGAIGLERFFYAPLNDNAAGNFIIAVTKLYSKDGLPHNHVTAGSVIDWNVPSDSASRNLSLSTNGMIAIQGTDTSLSQACQSNSHRYACEAFGGWATHAELLSDGCANNSSYWGSLISSQRLLRDTNLARDGSTIINPPQPDARAWWEDIGGNPGLNPEPVPGDQAEWLTYIFDYYLNATDTLWFWSVLATVRDGGAYSLVETTSYGKGWFTDDPRDCYTDCCSCRRGDANGRGRYPDEISLGDIMLLVDVKFISGDCTKLSCINEADVNADGGYNPTCEDNVTLGDIMMLVDFLFITGPDNMTLPLCP